MPASVPRTLPSAWRSEFICGMYEGEPERGKGQGIDTEKEEKLHKEEKRRAVE